MALALRYIPDIQKEYHDISQAQQARGIEMSKKQSLVRRLKSASAILIPLILSSNKVYPVTVAIMKYLGTDSAHYGQLAVASTVSALPAMIFALCIQKHLVRGLSFGAVKG